MTHDAERTTESVLRISGLSGDDADAYLSLDQLNDLPQTSFTCVDPWYKNEAEFGGVALYPLLFSLGIPETASTAVFHATNDYEVEVTLSDIRNYDYLLALGEDGTPYRDLPPDRNKGNVVVAIDFRTHDNLEIEVYKYHLAWWLDRIEIK